MAKSVSKTKESVTKLKTATAINSINNKSKNFSPIDFVKAFSLNQNEMDARLLTKFGLDPNLTELKVGKNLIITKKSQISKKLSFMLGDEITILDTLNDIDGNPIQTNQKLISRLHKIWSANKKTISFNEVMDLGIFTPNKKIKVGNNIILKNIYNNLPFPFTSEESYEITIENSQKDIEGKWLDEYVTTKNVKDALLNFKYNKKMLELKEVPLNKVLEIYLKDFFVTVKKSGLSSKGEHDLIIGDTVAIELKLSREIKESGSHFTAKGQIDTYSEHFKSNLLVVVAGIKSEQQEFYVQKVIEKAKKVHADWMFLEY